MDRRDHLILGVPCWRARRVPKLPPGFVHEVPQHLMHPDVPRDPVTGVPFVDLENYCCG